MAIEGQRVGFGTPRKSGIKGGMVGVLFLSDIGDEGLGKRFILFSGWIKGKRTMEY